MPSPTLLTAEDLERLDIPDKHTELVRGHLVVSEPPGFRHGDIVMALSARLYAFVKAGELGRVLAESGFILVREPDTVRGPDIAFVQRERVPDPIPVGLAPFAPDLAVEVLSPSDRPGKVLEKVADYLTAGTRLVWVVDADKRQARVYRSDGTISVIGESESLSGEDVLPGFTCPLSDLF